MALPKLETPTYELQLPSTGEKIKYRPFLVKEQKLLMIAQESNDQTQVVNTVSNLVNSCTFNKVNASTSPIFDVEYLFLQIRGKSVGETVEVNITCPDDEKTKVPVKINLSDIFVQVTDEHTNVVKLTDTISIHLRYPLMNDLDEVEKMSESETVFKLLNTCVHEIHYGDNIYHRTDMSDKELTEFIDQLTTSQFEKVMVFFNTMPKLRHPITVTNPNTKKKSEVILEGLQSFLE